MTASFGVAGEAEADDEDDAADGAAGGGVDGKVTFDPWPPHPPAIIARVRAAVLALRPRWRGLADAAWSRKLVGVATVRGVPADSGVDRIGCMGQVPPQ